MQVAVQKAKQCGVGTVTVFNHGWPSHGPQSHPDAA
jgi:hypothetical protein